MASTIKESSVIQPQNETPTEPEPCAETGKSALHLLREYSRERPEVIALWCFGMGFVLDWKLQPW